MATNKKLLARYLETISSLYDLHISMATSEKTVSTMFVNTILPV